MSKFPISPLPENFSEIYEYDAIICALGFERRASVIAGSVSAANGFAFGFDHNISHSYDRNLRFFKARGYSILAELANNTFGANLQCVIEDIFSKEPVHSGLRTFKICVDVSSFDRYRLAEIVNTISDWAKRSSPEDRVDIHFVYSIAKFVPPRPIMGRNEFAGPVHRKFAGRFADPSRPLTLIAGLGYEMGKVMGAAEYLQASRVVSFFPDSPISEFEPEVAKANASLLDSLRAEDKIHYPISDPCRTIAILDSVVRGLGDEYNIVVLPGGPKIFAVACLVLQRSHPEISVWRVSSGKSITAHDVEASGTTVGFRWNPE